MMDDPDTESAVRVCSVEDLSEGEGRVDDVDGTAVAVFLVDGDVYALNGVCPHQGGPLGDGKIEEGCVFCPWHGWQFDIETGEHVHGRANATPYDVSVEDGDVYVSL